MKMEKPKKELLARIGGSLLGFSVLGLFIPISYMRDNGFSEPLILLVGVLGLTNILLVTALAYRYLED